MSYVSDVLIAARTRLNDDAAIAWSDAVLIPKVQEAHRELQLNLELNGVPITKKQTAMITVTAGSLDLGVNQPTDLIEPTELLEGDVGDPLEDFVLMEERDYLPEEDQISELNYWTWLGGKIVFLGATQNRVVILRYVSGLTIPKLATDSLGFPWAELYLAPRVAAICWASKDDVSRATYFTAEAKENLEKILTMNVTGSQKAQGTRRYGYRRKWRSYSSYR